MRGLVVTLLLLILSPLPLFAQQPVFVAIIIDDLGNNLHRGKRAIDLPAAVTVSILPHSRHSKLLAEHAKASGKEVMVHMPMANIRGKPIGPGGLIPAMNRNDFSHTLRTALKRLPDARGVNNHMGSYLTQQRNEMNWLMDEIKRSNLFFVDSRTTPNTVASAVARQKSVFASSRDVFLDNEQTFYDIDRQFQQLIRKAKRRGTAIAIGHPYPITLDYLERALPQLELEGIQLIPASNLIAIQKMTEIQFAAQD